ncbi:PspC domain-containing protein [Corynebacterium vitaeruminis]|uniref:PspC domain-containing protein n=2 Tax=Corynebacterium vitaeruminis TaxID=38305 RepID=UPI0028A6C4DC|nr:PspC domain-containing protein [Corynebacterium vitaeruminis]
MQEAAYPQYVRRKDGAVLAGVATGLAAHLGLRVDHVRLALVGLALCGGLGLLIYIGLWIFTSARDLETPPETGFSRGLNYLLVVVACFGAGAVGGMASGMSGGVLAALTIIAVGAGLAWLSFDRADGEPGVRAVVPIAFGAVLVLGGVVLTIVQWSSRESFGLALAAVSLTLLGVAALGVPFGLRMWTRFNTQREEKLIADERAEIANRLHDSVLQTLAIIQKRADDPAEVRRIARGQERELRQWLFAPTEDTTVFAALQRACGEVEDTFGVRIAPVTVGEDLALTESLQAAVLAAREAMVNAAKHAGVDSVDVYAESFGGLELYVRDRGPGFNLDEVPADRHGVRDSILGRVERNGGTVTIKTAPGEGVEVAISMPQ